MAKNNKVIPFNNNRRMPMRPQVKQPAINKAVLPSLENQELEEELKGFAGTQDLKKLSRIVELLRDAEVFMPGRLNPDRSLAAEIWNDNKNDLTQIMAFTSKEQIPDQFAGLKNVLRLPFTKVVEVCCEMLKSGRKLDNLAVNPFSAGLRMRQPILEAILAAEEERKATGEKKPVALEGPKGPELHNEEIEALAEAFAKETEAEKRTDILNRLYSLLRTADLVLIPAPGEDGRQGVQIIAHKDTGKRYLQVLTDPKMALKSGELEKRIRIHSFSGILDMVLSVPAEELSGLALCAPKAVIRIERENLARVKAVNEKIEKGDLGAVEMAPEMRAAFEHRRFGVFHVPTVFAERGEAFVEELLEKKEAFVDSLFESMYYDYREYPYLEEEFGFMAVQADGDTLVITLDYPERDVKDGCAVRGYLIWNQTEKKGRYFSICQKAGKKYDICELAGKELRVLEEAPEDGNEWRKILELAANAPG